MSDYGSFRTYLAEITFTVGYCLLAKFAMKQPFRQFISERENLTECHDFLMEKMGARFKFMALSHPARAKTETEVTGFYKIDQDLSAFMRSPRNVEPGSFNDK